MTDREKVKIGLQCIIDGTVRCESCGYAIDKHGHHSCQQNCALDAVAMLEKQEPKAVLGIADSIEGIEVGKCPRCDRTIVNKQSDPTLFCKYCGQAVKWE